MTFGNQERIPILRDPAKNDEFHERGVVVIPFLDADEVASLRAAYRALRPPDDFGLTVDYMRPDRAMMSHVRDLVAPLWARHLPETFVDHTPALTTFVTKHPGERSNMFLHEDRSDIDERTYRAGTLWIPLVDIGPDIDNGVLYVIPRSHLLAQSFSGTGTPEVFRKFEGYLQNLIEPLTVPAGSAAFYDTRTLHTSPANWTDDPREALACSLVPVGAELIHVIATSRRHRQVHRVNDQFFLDVHPHSFAVSLPPEYPVIEEYDENIDLTAEEVAAIFDPDASGDTWPRPDDPAQLGTPDWLRARVAPRLPLATEDLPITAGYLAPPDAAAIDGIEIDVAKGVAGVLEVEGDGGVIQPLPAWAATLRPFLGRGRPGVVVLIDAGTEVQLRLPEGRAAAWRLDVIDAAFLGATLTVGTHAEPLDEARALILATGLDATLANLGPGVLAMLLSVDALAPQPAAAATGPRPLHRRVRGRLGAYADRARRRLGR